MKLTMRTLRALAFSVSVVLLPVASGCQSNGGAMADTKALQNDRATLAKLVGAWDFEGWNEPENGPRRVGKGKAAGVIEHSHFVLLDMEGTVLEAKTNRDLGGSILFSVEPKAGLKATAWSDNGPVVRQFRGEIQNDGSRLLFKNIQALGHSEKLQMAVNFASVDKWSVEFSRAGKVVAAYTFVRAR